VSEYLVEVYLPQTSDGIVSPGPAEVSQAADQVTTEGNRVRLLRSVLLPEDETGLYLFEAQSPELIVEVAARCGLRFERVVGAVSKWTADESLGPAP
jgi:hypothetical protein